MDSGEATQKALTYLVKVMEDEGNKSEEQRTDAARIILSFAGGHPIEPRNVRSGK